MNDDGPITDLLLGLNPVLKLFCRGSRPREHSYNDEETITVQELTEYIDSWEAEDLGDGAESQAAAGLTSGAGTAANYALSYE